MLYEATATALAQSALQAAATQQQANEVGWAATWRNVERLLVLPGSVHGPTSGSGTRRPTP